MPTVTVEEVKSLTGTTLPDSIVQKQIDIVISRSGGCLGASYPSADAELIALYAASAMADILDPATNNIKSESAANGNRITYRDREAFEQNSFAMQAKMLDSHGCLEALFPTPAGIGFSGQTPFPCGRPND